MDNTDNIKDCRDCKHSFYEDLDSNLCCELKNNQILKGILADEFKYCIPYAYDYNYPTECKNFESMNEKKMSIKEENKMSKELDALDFVQDEQRFSTDVKYRNAIDLIRTALIEKEDIDNAHNVDKPTIEVVNDVINTIVSAAEKSGKNAIYIGDVGRFSIKLKRKYGLLPKYPTLREYISDNEAGAYHYFIFKIMGVPVEVDGIFEFELVFKSNLLDEYVVTNDDKSCNGAGCDQYECRHYLTIEEKTKYE